MFEFKYPSEKEILSTQPKEEPMLDNLVNNLLNMMFNFDLMVGEDNKEYVIYMTEECYTKCAEDSTEKHKEKEELRKNMTICGKEVFILGSITNSHFHLPYKIYPIPAR
jgi:hypothetical protein